MNSLIKSAKQKKTLDDAHGSKTIAKRDVHEVLSSELTHTHTNEVHWESLSELRRLSTCQWGCLESAKQLPKHSGRSQPLHAPGQSSVRAEAP